MRGASKQDRLPKLSEMNTQAPIAMQSPEMAYGTSAMAVRELVRMGGPEKLLAFVESVGRAPSFEAALQASYEKDFAGLDQAVRTALSGR